VEMKCAEKQRSGLGEILVITSILLKKLKLNDLPTGLNLESRKK
jgi:hypothetical protein